MAVYTTASHSWAVGETVTAANMNSQVRDFINGWGAWTSYTPAWTATTNPALGNGTLVGNYNQVGKSVFFRIRLRMGSTTTFGSGAYFFSLPVVSSSGGGPHNQVALGFQNSTAVYRSAVAGIDPFASTFPIRAGDGTVNAWSPTVPWTWAANDEIRVSGVYEAN